MRTLVIGDVHGCIDELDALLDRLRADPDADRIVFVGDLVNKGPDSPAVYARFQELKAEAILGNHELRLLEQADRPRERDRSYAALEQAFGPKAWREFVKDIRGWPSFLDSPGWLVVHAGLVPGVAPADTPPEILANIRTWDGTGRDLQAGDNPPWFEFYRDGQLVVFGHWAALGGWCGTTSSGWTPAASMATGFPRWSCRSGPSVRLLPRGPTARWSHRATGPSASRRCGPGPRPGRADCPARDPRGPCPPR